MKSLIDDAGRKVTPDTGFPGFGSNDRAARRYASGPYGAVGSPVSRPEKMYPTTSPEPGSSPETNSASPVSDAGSGSPEIVGTISGATPSSDGRSYQLNFEATDVASVAKAILGDILQVNYLLDPRVSGQINLTSSQPVPRDSLIPLLETSLLSINGSLTKDGAVYRIAPVTEPRAVSNVGFQAVADGYGTTVIPARYVAAPTLTKILEGLGGRNGTVKVEPTANLIMIQGTAAERRAIVAAAGMVDVDWMRSRSVAILPVMHAGPETVIAELNRILGTGEGGLSQDVVQMRPMTRLNAVLVVSQRADAIALVSKWVRRLDDADYRATGIKVYRLKYAQAKTVAATLNRMFGGRQTSVAGQSDEEQLEPGGQDGPVRNGTDKPTTPGATSQTQATPASATQGGSNTGNQTGATKTAFSDIASQKSSGSEDAADTTGGETSGSGSRKVRITADLPNNTLFIDTNPQTYRIVERAIREMDRYPTQINIEVTIAEVTLTDELEYGVQFFLTNSIGQMSAGLAGAKGVPIQTTYPGLNLVAGALSDPHLVLDALSKLTTVRVLSSPSLMVVDRQPAVLQVGDQVPVLTRQVTSSETLATANSVEMKDTGIILNVLPRVNAHGIVTLSVEQQISSVADTSSNTLTPTISQRRVRSTISVSSGQAVLLAGLITDNQNLNRNGMPFVTKIKVLNDLLASHDRTATRTELIIFIRPRIVASPDDAQRVSEEFLDRMRNIEPPTRPVYRK
ncbi:type II secretion system secretin GspD [Microbacteriaceae bacterium K1510]|nr:type II secretion system secretin GspD [Microbacteriaceae bacterium K1510]